MNCAANIFQILYHLFSDLLLPCSFGSEVLSVMGRVFPIANENVLLWSALALVLLITWEYYDTQVLLTLGSGKPDTRRVKAPENDASEDKTTCETVDSDRPNSPGVVATGNDESEVSVPVIPDDSERSVEHEIDHFKGRSASRSVSRYQERISVSESITNVFTKELTREEIEALTSKIMNPLPAGCEPYSKNADIMAERLPNINRADISRFLVARKGNVAAAIDMAEKCAVWRASVFPINKEDLRAAVETGCFFTYKTARDGTPCVYMRGGLYDNTKATPEQFVLAAAYAIEYSLRTHPDQINVTVVVDTVIIPGAPNLGADMTFIKLFVKVCVMYFGMITNFILLYFEYSILQALSDNFPERLKRIVMYPFPWYGRAIWSVVKVFVDKRTQDKALLIGDTGKREIPAELAKFVDPDNIPECCAGNCKDPILNLLTTL